MYKPGKKKKSSTITNVSKTYSVVQIQLYRAQPKSIDLSLSIMYIYTL